MLATAVPAPVREIVSRFNRIVLRHRVPAEFSPKTLIHLKKGRFTLKSVETREELECVLRLRYEIFHREYKKKRNPLGYDVDSFDSACDHLLIRDDDTHKIVGTYRIISSIDSANFYSEAEFDIRKFLDEPGVKLELGRACIDHRYRNGAVIGLLWRGISEYMQRSDARYLFGCASVKTTDVTRARQIIQYLKAANAFENSYEVAPTADYTMPGLDTAEIEFSTIHLYDADQLLPSLFRSYLKAGAKVHGLPALDRDFHCADFLAILDVSKMADRFDRKYKSC